MMDCLPRRGEDLSLFTEEHALTVLKRDHVRNRRTVLKKHQAAIPQACEELLRDRKQVCRVSADEGEMGLTACPAA